MGAVPPRMHDLLTTPLPLPPPSPASVLEEAASGSIARYIVEHEVELTLRLMSTVKVSDVSVETMCVINAAIVFFLISERNGNRAQLTERVRRCAAVPHAAVPPAVEDPLHDRYMIVT